MVDFMPYFAGIITFMFGVGFFYAISGTAKKVK